MANPTAPTEGLGRRIPFLVDPANPADPFLAVGEGDIDMGMGSTAGAVAATTRWARGSDGAIVKGHDADTFKPFDLSTVTTEQLAWTPAGGKKFRLLSIHIKATVETTVGILDGTGGSTIYTVGCPAGVPVTIPLGAIGILSGAADRAVYLTSSDSADLSGTLSGTEE